MFLKERGRESTQFFKMGEIIMKKISVKIKKTNNNNICIK